MIIFDSKYLGNIVAARVSPKMFNVVERPQDAHGIFPVFAEDAHFVGCWGFIEQDA
jgi:hypothetical protein